MLLLLEKHFLYEDFGNDCHWLVNTVIMYISFPQNSSLAEERARLLSRQEKLQQQVNELEENQGKELFTYE